MKQGSDVPPFVKYVPCTTCGGRGWKREQGGYGLITCPICKGEKKLPMWDDEGNWMKKSNYKEVI